MAKKWVYLFTEGGKEMRNLLGGKGANVAEMTKAGLPVPPGFTITTEACNEYFRLGKLRCEERIPISQVVWALLLTRRNLWHFIELQGWDTVFDLRQQLDLELLVVRFFDRAILHAVRGHESGS